MTDTEARITIYNEISDRVNELYGTRSEMEHQFVREFFEGSLPVFKLILTQDDDGIPGLIVASFHIEVEAAVGIQWFIRLRQLEPNLHVTACYLRDADGVTYLGDDAHILKMYMVEQEVLSGYLASEKDPEDVLKKVKSSKPSPIKAYIDYKAATIAFRKLNKKSGQTEH